MGYFHVGNDWDGLAGLDGPGLGAAAQPQLAVRRSIPVGSIVPTLRARKAYAQKLPTSSEAAALRAARLRTASRLRAVLAMPSKQIVQMARTLAGFSGLGAVGDEGAIETLRGLSGNLHDAYAEIGDLGISSETEALLGGTLLGQRAGEISGALGLDVSWRDLILNAGPDFARIRNDLQSVGVGAESILTTIGFEHIGAVFRDQGQSVASLQNLAGTARGLYDRYGAEVMNYIAGDAGAFGEGGLRRMMEGALGESAGQWLNGANLQRLGGVAQAWIGAGQSGTVSGYLSAGAGTLAAVGTGLAAASVAVPAGTIIAAVGALITLLAALLGDEQPPPPPEIRPCEGASPRDWQRNPEAWAALSMWLVAKDLAFRDSDYYKEADSRGVLVQQLVAEAGWFATIDRYTGEVMVREPGIPGHQPAMRRLLDVIDRSMILPPGQEERALIEFDMMRPVFGMEPRSTRWGGTNFLWCHPNPMETLTRFFGAERYRIGRSTGADTKLGTTAFRSDPDGTNTNPAAYIGGGFGWERWISNQFFWKGYMRTMALSMYLGGTVPYGARGADIPSRSPSPQSAVYFSTGVGGSDSQYPIEIRALCGGMYPSRCSMPMSSSIWIPDHGKSNPLSNDGEEIPLSELPSRLADQEWCLAHRVPQPSPDMQSQPGTEVKRSPPPRCSESGVCLHVPTSTMSAMAVRRLAPGFSFKRIEKGDGMGRGTKIALGIAGGAAVVGGGYLAWRHLRRRG